MNKDNKDHKEFVEIVESIDFGSKTDRNLFISKEMGLSKSAIDNLIAGRAQPKKIHIIAIKAIKRGMK